jgi:site-specific DNA-methyltransferase (adenine-specific)
MGLSGGGYTYEWNGVTKLWRCPKERMQELHDTGRIKYTSKGTAEYIRYLDEMPGMPLQDTWTDISPINSQAAERLGYPTQKPMKLLERIIKASSNEGDVILDAYCGCGTTIDVANQLHRNWIGIDITYQSISLILKRLDDAYGEGTSDSIQLNGVPHDMASAVALAHKKDDRTRKEFEKWTVLTYSKNKAIINEKKGADKGVDGIAMILEASDRVKEVIFSVKSGGVTVNMIRDLRGVLDRQDAAMGIFITLEPPTKPMIEEAKSAGAYTNPLTNQSYDRIKIVTVQDILNREYLNIPTMTAAVKSAKEKVKDNQQKLSL